jgi:hypothetical protein
MTKKSKNHQMKKVLLLVMCVLILNIIFTSYVLANQSSEPEQNVKREQEINASNTLALIIFSVIVFIVILYFSTDYAVKKKHINRAKRVAGKAKKIVIESEEEQDNQIKEQEEILKKAEIRRNQLEKQFKRKRSLIKSKNKFNVLSEFDEDEEYLKPSNEFEEKKLRKRKDVFINLDNLTLNKEPEKNKKESNSRKYDDELFDKVAELAKKKRK